MNHNKYLNTISAMWTENKLLKFFVVAIGATVAWNTVQIERSFDSHTTILIPSVVSNPIEISGDHASEGALDAYARSITNLIGTFTPATARSQFASLLTFFSPESFSTAETQLYDLADRIEVSRVSNAFFVQKIVSSPNELHIYGLNKQFSESGPLKDEQRVYQVAYEIRHGRFSLTQPIIQTIDPTGGLS